MKSLGLLEKQATAWGIRLDRGQRDLLLRYAYLLAMYEGANVIGTRDPDRIVLDHILDSLSCFLHEPLAQAGRLADVGSGAGLPGIPINLVRRELQTTLVESIGKKARFLRSVVDDLSMETVEIENTRAEDLGRAKQHRGVYRVATTRAVASLPVVAEYCVPLLALGGCAIAMKGRLDAQELSEGRRAVAELGAEVREAKPVTMIPGVEDKERNLVIVEKVRETPARYPRRPGMAAKMPLGTR
jgi:16S rRNA (guanine527-N7)-methyltransferase